MGRYECLSSSGMFLLSIKLIYHCFMHMYLITRVYSNHGTDILVHPYMRAFEEWICTFYYPPPMQVEVVKGCGRYIPRQPYADIVYSRILQRDKVRTSMYMQCIGGAPQTYAHLTGSSPNKCCLLGGSPNRLCCLLGGSPNGCCLLGGSPNI